MTFDGVRAVHIEITSRCNLSCLYCSKNRFGHHRAGEDMPIGMFASIVDMFPSSVAIQAYLSGEPLLHHDLCDIIRVASDHGHTSIRIHTNGILMTRGLAEDLIQAGLTEIIFSIDGRDAQDYERIRSVSFDHAKERVVEFLDVNAGRIGVGVQCMVSWPGEKVLNRNLSDIAEKLDFVMVEYPHSWVYAGLVPDAEKLKREQVPCGFLNGYMAISVRGNCLPCCCCLNEEMVLGNVASKSAREIWENEMEAMRIAQTNWEIIPLCSSCERYGLA